MGNAAAMLCSVACAVEPAALVHLLAFVASEARAHKVSMSRAGDTHLHPDSAQGLIVALCLLQRHLQLGEALLEAIQLHTNLLSLLLGALQ
jgi:hypothetical protein